MNHKIFCIALLILMFGSSALAQAKRKPSAFDLLVETERAFSRASEEKGTSQAFLEYFEKGGLAFVPEPQTVEDVFGDAETAKRLLRYRLVWQPIYGDVSAAEDLGYITGVSERTDTQSSSAPVRYGAFFSVWRRQPDSSWKVLLDCGARTPQPVAALDASFTASPNRGGKHKFYQADDAQILKAERSFYQDWQKNGAIKAYSNIVNENSRLHRMDQIPRVGVKSIGDFLASQAANVDFSLTKTGISKSGDLGYAYGNYETFQPNAPKEKNEKGVFFRVWQRDARGKWKLVVDVMKASSE